MKKHAIALLATLTLLPAIAMADVDDALYDPVAPAGSAFVRFINAGDKDESLDPVIRGKKYDSIEQAEVGAYVPVTQGAAAVSFGPAKIDATLNEKSYYTIVLHNGALQVMEDAQLKDVAKAQIAAYTLTAKPLTLKTADGKIAIIPEMQPGTSGYRDLNPLQIPLAAFEGDVNLDSSDPWTLKRGAQTTVLILPTDGSIEVQPVQAKMDTTQ